MVMPTTRRGRYLFYRSRQAYRRKRANKRKASHGPGGRFVNGHATRRGLDTSGWQMQEPRTYPKDPTHFTPFLPNDLFWRIKPRRGVWGVPHLLPPYNPFGPGDSHRRNAAGNYLHRRVLACPRLHSLPVRAWLFPKELLPPIAFFPFDFYWSGRPSYRSTLPP